MTLSPELRSLRGSIAANTSWANTTDRSARTAKARRAAMDRFERQVDPDGVLLPEERAKMAANARRAHFQRMAFKSAKVRRSRHRIAARHDTTGNRAAADVDREARQAGAA